ncbi:uncharacterized protein LOC118645745 [Monomorium pharaonis]|uniref:uncharacterized protein LOC118645745 n=1 Tax=Monomorium pharaonis TaxID=307658 RepID=UPI0017467E87|nr:uncharacterized protein LOC118645745 [Monomorium pharaonis]
MYAARLSEKNIAIASCVCGVVWCGVVWCGMVWCGVAWCGVLCVKCIVVAFLAASGPLSPLPPSLLQDDRCGPLRTRALLCIRTQAKFGLRRDVSWTVHNHLGRLLLSVERHDVATFVDAVQTGRTSDDLSLLHNIYVERECRQRFLAG